MSEQENRTNFDLFSELGKKLLPVPKSEIQVKKLGSDKNKPANLYIETKMIFE